MSEATPEDQPTRQAPTTRDFARSLERVYAGTPLLFLLTGNAADVRPALAAAVADTAFAAGTRVLEIEPDANGQYDPVRAAALAWKRGARRVVLDSRRRELAWSWLGVVPFWGSLVAAIWETMAALGQRRDPTRDADAARLLLAARRRPLIILLHELHRTDRAAASRLCALVAQASPGIRLLIAGDIDPSASTAESAARGGEHAVLTLAKRLPAERVLITRLTTGEAIIEPLLRGSPAAAAAVQAAAVLGEEFDGAMLARLLGIDELAAEDRLAVVVRAGLLRVAGTRDLPDGDVATLYRFVDSGTRAAVLAATPTALRAQLEARVGGGDTGP
jgi:hypothetical protein